VKYPAAELRGILAYFDKELIADCGFRIADCGLKDLKGQI